MKRIDESALRNMIRKLRQTGVTRDPKMTRGRRCIRVEVGDIVTSRAFGCGYRDGDVTVVGIDRNRTDVKIVLNPLRARANYVVESVQEITAAPAGQLVRARRLAKNGRYDPRGEVIVFRQTTRNRPQGAAPVKIVGRLRPAERQLQA